MSSYDNVTSLPRTHEKADLSKLAPRRCYSCQPRSQCSKPRSSFGRSESGGSESSQALYMAPKKRRRKHDHGQSLSTCSNGSNRKFDGPIEEKHPIQDYTTAAASAAAEDMSWNIIDREIFEWQYVCETGRPYWWSSEMKDNRIKKLHTRFNSESRNWMKNIDQRAKPEYSKKRRAVTDTYLADPAVFDNVQDLAYLIAVQLLGACFTLPPDCVVGIPAPAYTIVNRNGGTLISDPRLISSLRMHTHFRYTPSFGHHARSSSPVSIWPGIYDGSSVNSSPNDSGIPTPDVVGDAAPPLQRLSPRQSPAAGQGTPENSLDLKTTADRPGKSSFSGLHLPDLLKNHPDIPENSKKARQRSRRSSNGTRTFANSTDADGTEAVASSRGFQSSNLSAKTNYCLQPIIRFEPHHVFVQPVKELVVKRWRTFRRRLSGSIHGNLPGRALDGQTTASESDATGPNSPFMSSDSRYRRLRAQERGDIHSSIESTPHYNTPASGASSPNGNDMLFPSNHDPQVVTSLTGLSYQLATIKPIDSETSSSTLGRPTRPQSLYLQLAAAGGPSQHAPSSALATCNTTRSRSDFSPGSAIGIGSAAKSEFPFSPLQSSPSLPTSNSLSSRRGIPRQRRKSTLSEVHTPDDFLDVRVKLNRERSIFSAIGSALPSPYEDEINTTFTRQLDGVLTSPGLGSFLEMTPAEDFPLSQRPKISRTTTSGTQIFTPNEDGVEIDGLPVGPKKDAWTGKRREATYL